MPGSVANAAPTTVLPFTLSRAYSHSREYFVEENNYRNGESQRRCPVASSRKRWRFTKRLIPADLQALRTFYDARKGGQEPFYFYDMYDTSPKFQYDSLGIATTGRYTVRFEGAFEQVVEIGRCNCSIELVELA